MTTRQLLASAFVLATVTGCAVTQQARDVSQSGFLGEDYSLLQPGQDEEALLIYRNPSADWASYDRIRLDPVTIWIGTDSSFEDFSQPDRQQLADHFYSAILVELSADYTIVETPGPGVLLVQVALTDAQASNPALDTISTVVPIGLAVSQTVGLVTGKPSFVGEASAEARLVDGATGELLAAAVDRRVGGKALRGEVTDSWGDVDEAFAYWARQLRYRLCTERGDADCVPPEA